MSRPSQRLEPPRGLARCSYRPPLPKDRPRSREGTLMARRSQGGQPPDEALPNPRVLGVSPEPEQRSLAPLRFLPSRRSPLLNLERSSRTDPDHPRRGGWVNPAGKGRRLFSEGRGAPDPASSVVVPAIPRDSHPEGLPACLQPFGAGTGGLSSAPEGSRSDQAGDFVKSVERRFETVGRRS